MSYFRGASADGTRVFFETEERLTRSDQDGGDTDIFSREGGKTTLISAPQAPQTSLEEGPGETTNDATPTFKFSSDTAGVDFECSVDGADFEVCSGPGTTHTTEALGNGRHTFMVLAVTAGGIADQTPASARFRVDTVPPETTITEGPSGKTRDGTPTFRFFASPPGNTFECKVDADPFAGCASPFKSSRLPLGTTHIQGASDRFRREHRDITRQADLQGQKGATVARHAYRLAAPLSALSDLWAAKLLPPESGGPIRTGLPRPRGSSSRGRLEAERVAVGVGLGAIEAASIASSDEFSADAASPSRAGFWSDLQKAIQLHAHRRRAQDPCADGGRRDGIRGRDPYHGILVPRFEGRSTLTAPPRRRHRLGRVLRRDRRRGWRGRRVRGPRTSRAGHRVFILEEGEHGAPVESARPVRWTVRSHRDAARRSRSARRRSRYRPGALSAARPWSTRVPVRDRRRGRPDLAERRAKPRR